MDNIDQALAAASQKLRAILGKKKRGQKLSAPEQTFLAGALGIATVPVAPAGVSPARPKKSSSLAAAVADLKAQGIEVRKEFLKQLKREGGAAAGFEASNRVNLDKLIPYLKSRLDAAPPIDDGALPSKEILERQKLLEQVLDVREIRAIRAREFIKTARGLEINNRLAQRIDKVIYQWLVNEWPAAVAGKSVQEARQYGLKLYKTIMHEHAQAADEWKKPTK